jgi:hypothetical protein
MCDRGIEIFLPFLMTEAITREHGLVSAACWMLLDRIHSEMMARRLRTKKLTYNAEFSAFSRRYLFPYRKMLNTPYGGKIRIC